MLLQCNPEPTGFGKGVAEGENGIRRIHAHGFGNGRRKNGFFNLRRAFNHDAFGQLLIHQFLQADGIEKLNHAAIQ